MADELPDEIEELTPERRPAGAGAVAARLPIPDHRMRLAWMVAIAADFLQIVAFPLFFLGAASPWVDGLDLVVALILTRLLGWHWAFLPAAVAELVPFFDLVPTWTMAVFLVSRGRK